MPPCRYKLSLCGKVSHALLSSRPRFNALLLGGVCERSAYSCRPWAFYGVLGFLVDRRFREIGVRIALGADAPCHEPPMVLGNAVRWIAAGLVLGLALSIALSRALNSMLYGMTAYDPVAWTSAAAVLVLTALAAVWQPSRRAARVDPVEALRHD